MNDLPQSYRTFFGKGDALYQLFSPYRICPLGAHVDHQHGLVSGFAFNSGIEFLFSATDSGKVEMAERPGGVHKQTYTPIYPKRL